MASPGADLMEKRIRDYLEVKSGFGADVQKERMLAREFKYFDTDNSGSISEDELCAVLKSLNCLGSKSDISDLMDRYDSDCNGSISYSEFVTGIFKRGFNDKDSDGTDPNATKGIINKVRSTILSKTKAGNGIKSAQHTLKRFDTDGSGNLDADELVRGLEMLGLVGIEPADCVRLMNAFDKDKSGRISVDEFYKGLQGSMPRRRKLVVRMAFDVLDADDSGFVTVDDIKDAYDVSQHPDVISEKMTTEEALAEILDTYDQGDRDGIVTFMEFLEYYKDISCMISNDDYFELMVRNAWHISGGEGEAKNTSCRRVKVLHGDGSEKIYEVENDLGIGPKDLDKMRVKLVAQGVLDIKAIEV